MLAMSNLPTSVEFHEEGPREGFQMEPKTYPLADRAALIDALSASGLKQIQVASFVSPRAVPQMADASELFAAITKRPGTRYTALWLNDNGFERARACEQVDLDGKLMFYTTEPFSQRNNNCSVADMRERQLGWLDRYIALGIPVEKAYVITAFGCNLGGAVPLSVLTDQVRWLVDACADRRVPLPAVYLADTMGWAHPEEIKRRVGAVREIVPQAQMGLHLHDTRGVGGANVYAALQMGVRLFDSSVAGLCGCPFAGHTPGRPQVEPWRTRLSGVANGGRDAHIQRHRARGKLLLRERIDFIVDDGSAFLELSPLAAWDQYGNEVPGAGIVTGVGMVAERPCMFIANDATVKGGSFFHEPVKKHVRAQEIAERLRLSCLYLVDCGGAFLPEQDHVFPDKDHFGNSFHRQCRMSQAGLPQLSAVFGGCTAGGAYIPALSDEVVMVRGNARIHLGGPSIVKIAINEVDGPPR